MKRIAQFRFHGSAFGPDGIWYYHNDNYPADLDRDTLVFGNIFQKLGPVSQLGIQAPPGTRFFLNNSAFPIMVGETGIYELNLEGIGRITAISFNKDDLDELYKLKVNGDSVVKDNKGNPVWDVADKILIDVVYEGA